MIFTENARRSEDTQQVTTTAAITEADPRPLYRGSATLWRPETITARWTRTRVDGGPWGSWHGTGSVSGPRMLRSGKPSPSQRHCDRWVAPDEHGDELTGWIASMRPADEVRS